MRATSCATQTYTHTHTHQYKLLGVSVCVLFRVWDLDSNFCVFVFYPGCRFSWGSRSNFECVSITTGDPRGHCPALVLACAEQHCWKPGQHSCNNVVLCRDRAQITAETWGLVAIVCIIKWGLVAIVCIIELCDSWCNTGRQ